MNSTRLEGDALGGENGTGDRTRTHVLKKIEEHLVLITLLLVWSAIILYTFTRLPFGQIEAPQIITFVLTVVALSGLIAVIPATAVAYGRYTGKKAGAALLGVILLPAIYTLGYLAISHNNMVFIRVPETLLYLTVLSIISGLAGYCAAHRTQRYLAVAIVLIGVWVFAMTSGIN